ncbi:GNAT family N-acetyltransferase [Acidovorax sp.]|uniref:GNAT family N-acetyltransferase n=1 Tax=Acidovorax sp. TaxID=1872122 RepID=UPI002ACE1393|nr:GNAT family N-acetyltransferase [Acidovorax sp.]MDZ7863750.1 GNAT family N-acetyltransferase [Acidovorax sp.]
MAADREPSPLKPRNRLCVRAGAAAGASRRCGLCQGGQPWQSPRLALHPAATPAHSRFLGFSGLAVSPAFQGRGCARILLEQAQRIAQGLHLDGLRLYTNKQFASNVQLYLHHGFAVDREEPFMGGFTVYMSKPFAA